MIRCEHCDEEILPQERVPAVAGVKLHHECLMRTITGSVAHIERRCSCFVRGSKESDPPGMTKREAARAAFAAYRKIAPLGVPICNN